jgi:glutamate N-acetyltransferase/amino-acid N-acetyltransferase
MEKLLPAIRNVATRITPDAGPAVAQAIMTTDTLPKQGAVGCILSTGKITIGGVAKGSGMIHPDMATMLGVITTDAKVAPELLQAMLHTAVEASFNRISVDGDTSTNDTVILLANGAAGAAPVTPADQRAFQEALTTLCTHLAQLIVRDGEGASKFVTITVSGAENDQAATAVAQTIATSPLVKTAFAGSDANWGRILAAAGRAGVNLRQEQIALWIGISEADELQLVRGGTPTPYAEADAANIFAAAEICLRLDLGDGTGESTVWTTDLTHEYIRINADYRS